MKKTELSAKLAIKMEGGGSVEKGTLTIDRSDGKKLWFEWVCNDGECISTNSGSDLDSGIIKEWMYEHIQKTAEELCWNSKNWKRKMTWAAFLEAIRDKYHQDSSKEMIEALGKEAQTSEANPRRN